MNCEVCHAKDFCHTDPVTWEFRNDVHRFLVNRDLKKCQKNGGPK